MPDIRGSTGGLPHQTSRRYFSQGDGTHAEGHASLLYEWSTSDLDWIKVTGDSTGAINTLGGSSGAASSSSVAVTSGSITVTNTGFQVTNAPSVTVTSGSITVTNTARSISGGTVGASISNAPSVTVTSGSITVTNASFGLTGGNVGASISNAPSVTVTSGSVTVTNASFGLTGGNVGASISNAPSVTVTSGSITLTNASVGQGTGGAVVPWTQNLVSVGSTAVAATAKGTQGTNFVNVQDAKDSGRSYVVLTGSSVTGSSSEALISLVSVKQGVSTAASTAYTVTSGKTLRVTSISVSVKENAAAIAGLVARLRHATSGVVSTSSPVAYLLPEIRTSAATANLSAEDNVPIPDGIEFAAAQQIALTQVASSTTCNLMVTVCGFEY